MIKILLYLCSLLILGSLNAEQRYGEAHCHQPDYHCIKVKANESWAHLFPNEEQQDIVMRVNRMNIPLKSGMIIAIPNQIDRLSIYDVSPFPRYMNPLGEKIIIVNQKELAYGAYDEEGELIWWGPISSGKSDCHASGGCKTPIGLFRIIRKQAIDCISTEFPRHADGTKGGAEMPYCMHFYRGYALHGSRTVPGFRDSHGCVRLFTEDARWLNEEFIHLPENGHLGTRVIVIEP